MGRLDEFRRGAADADDDDLVHPLALQALGPLTDVVLGSLLGWLIVRSGAIVPHSQAQWLVLGGLVVGDLVHRGLDLPGRPAFDGPSTRTYILKAAAAVVCTGVLIAGAANGAPPLAAAGLLAVRLSLMTAYAGQGAFVVWAVIAAAMAAVPVIAHAPQMVFSAGEATARHGVEDALRLLAVSGLFAGVTTFGRRSAEHRKEREKALTAERSRIARELHDVVAHQMTSVVLLSQGASAVLPTDPDQVRGALGDIERTSREALVELRRMLGLLRDDAGETLGGPQPTLDELPALVRSIDAFDAATVNLDVTETVPAGVQLSAYRIVQEAVTNAARYAPGSRVEVALKTTDHRLGVTVSDTGARAGARLAGVQGSGLGLTGMRERAELLGGQLHAGKNGRGWTVTASLPLGDDASV